MPRGGARANAGRKAGTATKRTRVIADTAAAAGITPLEVMLDNMRFYHAAASGALDRLLSGEATPDDIMKEHGCGPVARNGMATLTGALSVVLELRKRSGEAARDAAPYIHSRLTAVKDPASESGPDEIPLVERLKRYARRDALEASSEKISFANLENADDQSVQLQKLVV